MSACSRTKPPFRTHDSASRDAAAIKAATRARFRRCRILGEWPAARPSPCPALGQAVHAFRPAATIRAASADLALKTSRMETRVLHPLPADAGVEELMAGRA
jgi:hypothetical protein